MTPRALLKWIAGVVLALFALPFLPVAIFSWNGLHAPIERMVLDKTGRELVIGGDLAVSGRTLAQLYPLFGIAVPETGAYAMEGQRTDRR